MSSPVVQQTLSADDVAAVKALVAEVEAADGTPPLSDHVLLHLPQGGDHGVLHVLVSEGPQLVGYGHLDVTDQVEGSSGELAVLPSHRGHGLGQVLARELLRLSTDGRLRLWAHGSQPAAARLASSLGFAETRVLWQMRLSLTAPLPAVSLPEGVAVRTFVVGQDEEAWTALNARAFAHHPDQGSWGVDEVLIREKESWFDPLGFFLAFRGPSLVAFHWTKVHGLVGGHSHDAVGEVYVVGVDPAEQGHGLGPVMTLLGLHHLREAGLPSVLLYVDESNTGAIKVYERLGFTTVAKDIRYSAKA